MQSEGLQEIGTLGMAVYVLVEIFKQAGFPRRFYGLLSLGLGLVIGVISFLVMGKPWLEGLIAGFWGAASASGVYSGTKATFKSKNDTTVSFDDDPALRPQC
jgi:xanthine/uracil permease